jgi:arabinogalactan endo-1,4-beta-galactosidase
LTIPSAKALRPWKVVADGLDTVRLVFPDSEDKVSELEIGMSKDTMKTLASGKVNLELYTDYARLILPQQTIAQLDGEYHFKFTPVKNANAIKSVEDRAKQEKVVQAAAGTGDIKVVGRPMTIETGVKIIR